jgi:hypothetical protein
MHLPKLQRIGRLPYLVNFLLQRFRYSRSVLAKQRQELRRRKSRIRCSEHGFDHGQEIRTGFQK